MELRFGVFLVGLFTMAVDRNALTLQDRELADLQIFFYERPKRVRSKKSYKEFASDEENSEVANASDDAKRRKARASRKKESPSHMAMEKKQKLLAETLRWLGDNYELKESMCLPRCVMYTHYLDFCKKGSLCPSGPATFGKVIRQKFPKLTTRRLGTRGQSKYHYYGIRVKESSQYFHAGYSKQGLTRFSTMKAKAEGQAKKFALNPKVRTLLPEFPNAKRLNLPKGVSQQKVETFIMMYRTHCQRLLDTVISANFDGINNFILHFWQGMPNHMISVLQSPVVVDVIAICDSILYKVLIDVLIPSSIQDLPDSLREEIRDFSSNLHVWLRDSLSDVPSTVRNAKLKVAQRFSSALRRQVSFVHLAQTARSVLLSYDSVSRMISDLRKIDFSLIMNEAVFLLEKKDIPAKTKKFVQEFEGLLSKQAPLEAYTEWLDSVVDRCILKNLEEGNDKMFERRASEFMGMWSFISSKVLEDLTLRSAPSFGVFHLIYTTFQEYILLIIDNQKMLEVDKELQNALQMHLKEGFLDEREECDWSDVRQAENETREESLVTKQVYEPDHHPPINKSTGDNNNNSIDHSNNNKDKRTNKKNKTSKISESTRFHPRSISRTGLIGQHAVISPIVPRQIPLTCTAAPDMVTISSTKQMYTQHPSQTLVANVTMTDRSGRNIPQYGYPDEVSRNATQAEMSAFHGQDFINAMDKSMYGSNVNASGAEFLGTPWLQPDSQSLTVLNNVGYTDPIGSTPGGLEMNYHRNADFGFGYSNEIGIGNSAIHPLELQTPVSHRSDISYSQPGKESDYSNYQNVLSRYNSLYFDSMRATVPPMTPDMLSYTGMIQSTTTSMDIEGILAHEAQMSRLGVGAV